jgi:hypothetical protein
VAHVRQELALREIRLIGEPLRCQQVALDRLDQLVDLLPDEEGLAGGSRGPERSAPHLECPGRAFASNSVLGIAGNRDLFMNTVGWLSQQENLISIRPREAADRRITLTATQQTNMLWLSLLVVPGLIFASGVYSWWRRR